MAEATGLPSASRAAAVAKVGGRSRCGRDRRCCGCRPRRGAFLAARLASLVQVVPVLTLLLLLQIFSARGAAVAKFRFGLSVTRTVGGKAWLGPPHADSVVNALTLWRERVLHAKPLTRAGEAIEVEFAGYNGEDVPDDQSLPSVVQAIYSSLALRSELLLCPSRLQLVPLAVRAAAAATAAAGAEEALWICWSFEERLYFENPLGDLVPSSLFRQTAALYRPYELDGPPADRDLERLPIWPASLDTAFAGYSPRRASGGRRRGLGLDRGRVALEDFREELPSSRFFDVNVPRSGRWHHALALARRRGATSIVILHDDADARTAEQLRGVARTLQYTRVFPANVELLRSNALGLMSRVAEFSPDVVLILADETRIPSVLFSLMFAHVTPKALVMEIASIGSLANMDGNVLNNFLAPMAWAPPLAGDRATEVFGTFEQFKASYAARFPPAASPELAYLLPNLSDAGAAAWAREHLLAGHSAVPPLGALQAVAAGELYVSALRSAGTTARAAVADALRSGTHRTVLGDVEFDDRGLRLNRAPFCNGTLTQQWLSDLSLGLKSGYLDAQLYVVDDRDLGAGEQGVRRERPAPGLQETYARFASRLRYPMMPWASKRVELRACPEGCQFTSLQCKPCPLGKYKGRFEDACRNCGEGTYADTIGSTICQVLPPGSGTASSDAPAKPLARPGWYSIEREGTTPRPPVSCAPNATRIPRTYVVVRCPVKAACSGRNRCAPGSTGLLCAKCQSGYTYRTMMRGLRVCSRCEDRVTTLFKMSVLCCAYVALVYSLRATALRASSNMNSNSCAALRAVLQHINLLSCMTEGLGADGNAFPAVAAVMAPIGIFYRPFDILSLDCLFEGASRDQRFIDLTLSVSSAWIPFGLLSVIGLDLLVRLFAWLTEIRHRVQRFLATLATDLFFGALRRAQNVTQPKDDADTPDQKRQRARSERIAAREQAVELRARKQLNERHLHRSGHRMSLREEKRDDDRSALHFQTMHVIFALLRESAPIFQSMLAFVLVAYPATLRSLAQGFRCDSVAPPPGTALPPGATSLLSRLVDDMDVACYEASTRLLAMNLYLVVAISAPSAILCILWCCRNQHLAPLVRRATGVLFVGYKRDWLYWEVLCLVRIATFISIQAYIDNIKTRVQAMAGIFVVFLVLDGTLEPLELDRTLWRIRMGSALGNASLLGVWMFFFVDAQGVDENWASDPLAQWALGLSMAFNVFMVVYGLLWTIVGEFALEIVIAKESGCFVASLTNFFLWSIRRCWSLNHVRLVEVEGRIYLDSSDLGKRERAYLSTSLEVLLQGCLNYGSRFYPSTFEHGVKEGFQRAVRTRAALLRARSERFGSGAQPVATALGVPLGEVYQAPLDIIDINDSKGVTVEELINGFRSVGYDMKDNNPCFRTFEQRAASDANSAMRQAHQAAEWGSETWKSFMDELSHSGRMVRSIILDEELDIDLSAFQSEVHQSGPRRCDANATGIHHFKAHEPESAFDSPNVFCHVRLAGCQCPAFRASCASADTPSGDAESDGEAKPTVATGSSDAGGENGENLGGAGAEASGIESAGKRASAEIAGSAAGEDVGESSTEPQVERSAEDVVAVTAAPAPAAAAQENNDASASGAGADGVAAAAAAAADGARKKKQLAIPALRLQQPWFRCSSCGMIVCDSCRRFLRSAAPPPTSARGGGNAGASEDIIDHLWQEAKVDEDVRVQMMNIEALLEKLQEAQAEGERLEAEVRMQGLDHVYGMPIRPPQGMPELDLPLPAEVDIGTMDPEALRSRLDSDSPERYKPDPSRFPDSSFADIAV